MGHFECIQNNKNSNFGGFYSPFVPVFWLYAKHLRSSGMIGYSAYIVYIMPAPSVCLQVRSKGNEGMTDLFII